MLELSNFVGIGVMLIGALMLVFLIVLKIAEFLPTPRKLMYRKLSRLAAKEPEVFLNFMAFTKKKYNLKYKIRDNDAR